MATSADSGAVDRAAVRRRLDRVTDPELDRSIVELQYVDDLSIDGARVRIALKLPTAWCSPAFAWMMATDARDEVADLPAVEAVEVTLADHMHAEEINRGVNEGLSFDQAFEDADDDVESVRRTLDEKARMARQYRAMAAFRDAGVGVEQQARLDRGDVTLDAETGRAAVSLDDGAFAVVVDLEPIRRYVEKAREVGVLSGGDGRLFATPEGDPIPPDRGEAVYRRARLAKNALDGQAGICARLHEARYDEVELRD